MGAPPLYVTPVPKADRLRGQGPLVGEFIEGFCRVTKESVGGSYKSKIRLRDWQHTASDCVYAKRPDGRFRHRQALIGLPRKNGKSALGSSYGLHGLVMGPEGGEVYSCAADKEQARIVFGVAKRMVELDEQLSGIIKPYRDALEYTETGSIYKVLSSEAFTKEGLNPTTIVYDELHAAPNDELYNVMRLSQGSRRNPLLIAITTAGVKTDTSGQDSICYRLFQHGVQVTKGEIKDDTFFMAWWGAPDGANYRDEAVWAAANPGYDDLIDPEDFRSAIVSVPENEFRTKRLNQWVSQSVAWLPQGAFDACRSSRDFVPGERGVVLGLDASKQGDAVSLVAVTVDSEPQIKVLGNWEKPKGPDGREWLPPRGEIKDCIRNAAKDYTVREITWGEYTFREMAEDLDDEGLPVVEFPQTLSRMGPATQRFYEAVTHRKLSHDGHPALERHFENAVLKTDSRGSRLVKDARSSARRITLALATVEAIDRAAYWYGQPTEAVYTWKDSEGNEHSKPVAEIGFVW
jgi:phage terminase large subunit-like protein